MCVLCVFHGIDRILLSFEMVIFPFPLCFERHERCLIILRERRV
ncbi:hypothetical protein CSUI_007145 [Cystoisospora suis]|uniref:Uncharacterized protein n=1 Tax=Cystoisospora suis TaxID=483139 RepID=A0A2C6KNB1_9APIC|nr:hypothetical protein CSUI_007145 [Cystoisospora suis]